VLTNETVRVCDYCHSVGLASNPGLAIAVGKILIAVGQAWLKLGEQVPV
jgi:hypothetical protein